MGIGPYGCGLTRGNGLHGPSALGFVAERHVHVYAGVLFGNIMINTGKNLYEVIVSKGAA